MIAERAMSISRGGSGSVLLSRQVFDQAIAGALGALVGLYLYVELVHVDVLWQRDALAGFALGGSIGWALGAIGPWREGAWLRFARASVLGALAGGVGGALGLLAGEVVLGGFRGGLLGRAVSWGILGLAIGLSQALPHFSFDRLKMGLIGGGIGGFIGGGFFECLRELGGGVRYDTSQAVGVLLLGGGLGLGLAVAELALRRYWVVVLSGRQEGRAYLLAGKSSVVGLDEHVAIGLFGDLTVERKHAVIERSAGGMRILPIATRNPTRINGEVITGPRLLADGDRIELGRTKLQFRERGGARR
jgi:hypothetical protein